ncbi:MAG: MFS transporter [Rhodospirillales bacterium]|nr:MFS transporter [Rhodospirillales bacterium]
MTTTTAASDGSARLAIGFSCVGHSYSHLFAPIFFVAVLALEKDLGLTHGEAVALIVVGSALFGFAAPLAGWLGDRWSATKMMVLFFLGTGAGMVATAYARDPFEIALALAVTGLFASIYHPVGVAWLVRNAINRGTALGLNNMFGAFGPAAAALMAGGLIDAFGWRAAFLWPGLLVVLTGVAFAGLVAKGAIVELTTDRKVDAPASREDMKRALVVLFFTILCTALVYQATQPAMPKLFSERVMGTEGGVFGVSALVALVYALAGVFQIVAGKITDIFPPRRVYTLGFLIQAPILILVAVADGYALVALVFLSVVINIGTTTSENVLFARYTPGRWRSFAFGLKFIVALGVSAIGVRIEGWLYDWTGGFQVLFAFLAAIVLVGMAATLFVPGEKEEAKPLAQPAE